MLAKLSAGCLAATQAFAFIAPDSTTIPLHSVVARPELFKSDVSNFSDSDTEIEYDRISNAVRLVSGSKLFGIHVSTPTKAAFEKAALRAIAANKPIFGIDIDDVKVVPEATLVSGDDAAVSFHVYRNGIKIQDAGLTFRFKKGSLLQVQSETYTEAVQALSLNADTGAIAAQALGSTGYIGRGSAWRVKPNDAGYSLIKVDEYLVAGQEEAFVVQVDTSTGEIFELRSKNFHLQGSAVAKVYPRYFEQASADTGLAFAKPEGVNDRANERGQFQTPDDFTAPVLKGLIGQFIKVSTKTGTDLTATGTKVGGNWLIKIDTPRNPDKPAWDDNEMAQAMVYVHANRVISAAKKYVSPTWFDETLQANANLSQHCNAYWDGRTINFFSAGESSGKTCANTGLISDVVFHEWGHGLDHNTGGIDDGALSEGFGDGVSMYMTEDSLIGKEFLVLEHKPVRDLSVKKVFPKDVTGRVHSDGLIIGGTWWDLFNALKAQRGHEAARELMGKFLFKGIYQFKKMSDVYNATLVLDDDNADLQDGTPNLCIINAAFLEHGLAEKDARCTQ